MVDLVCACKCASEAKSRGRNKGIRIGDAEPLNQAQTNKHQPKDHQRVVAIQHNLCGEPGREREGIWDEDTMSLMYMDEAAGAPPSCALICPAHRSFGREVAGMQESSADSRELQAAFLSGRKSKSEPC